MDNNMNVLQVDENRDFINKAKEKMNIEKIRNDYKEKYIDTGKSQEFEARLEEDAKRKKKIIKIAGTAATIALIFIPADGPFGELCTILATPALCALVDVSTDIKKKLAITGKRAAEKYILHVDGSNQNVKGYSLDKKDIIEDFTNLKSSLDNLEGGLKK